MVDRQQIGRWGEQVAAYFLIQHGYEIIGRNVRTPFGEIDLIAHLDQTTVFVEVKTRSNTQMGMPENGITPRKQAHLIDSAEHYLQSHPEIDGNWRVDVIAVIGRPGDRSPQVEWFEDAVS